MEYKYKYQTVMGTIWLSSDGKSLTGLWLEGQKYAFATLADDCVEKEVPVMQEVKLWLDAYLRGENPAVTMALAPKGNDFRQSVWAILCRIPYGQVITYKDIAQQIATEKGIETMSAQAVGGAVGHNPISIIIPCHRVIGTNGKLTGYAGGIHIKERLLKLEGTSVSHAAQTIILS